MNGLHAGRPSASAEGDTREVTRQEAYRLRAAAEEARRLMEKTQAHPAERARQDFERAAAQRLEFWLDTCREAGAMRSASKQVLYFYKTCGCRFFEPTQQQVRHILEALDSALPAWDRDNPELFYQTLELNFPELLRRR
jgi:hypothetical protein